MRMRKGEASSAASARADRSIELVCLALIVALLTLALRIVSIVS
ncbi:hypothetical protein [Bradyrhizobium lablabi]|nr:hypothetical protein [Bradyrhizobium lablabi]